MALRILRKQIRTHETEGDTQTKRKKDTENSNTQGASLMSAALNSLWAVSSLLKPAALLFPPSAALLPAAPFSLAMWSLTSTPSTGSDMIAEREQRRKLEGSRSRAQQSERSRAERAGQATRSTAQTHQLTHQQQRHIHAIHVGRRREERTPLLCDARPALRMPAVACSLLHDSRLQIRRGSARRASPNSVRPATLTQRTVAPSRPVAGRTIQQ